MTTAEITTKVRHMKRLQAKADQLQAEITAIQDEIKATMTSAARIEYNKLYVVFQPHTYTRTKALMGDFAKALSLSDEVVLCDIYAARETDNLGISSRTLQDEIIKNGHTCHYFPTFDEVEKFLLKNCTKDDLLITMGAGDVYKIGDHMLGK